MRGHPGIGERRRVARATVGAMYGRIGFALRYAEETRHTVADSISHLASSVDENTLILPTHTNAGNPGISKTSRASRDCRHLSIYIASPRARTEPSEDDVNEASKPLGLPGFILDGTWIMKFQSTPGGHQMWPIKRCGY